MREAVFWSAAFPPLPPLPAAEPPREVDVAIVGAGLTGLSAALTLAAGGASVVALERHTAGWGASGRNGGQLSVGGKRPPQAWMHDYGPELGRRLWEASVESLEFTVRLIEREGIDCDLRRNGLITAAYKPAHFGHLAEKQAYLAEELGYEVELVPPLRLAEELGSRSYHGALVDRRAGQLNPYRFTRGLAGAAVRAGAIICEHTAVETLAPRRDGFEITTQRGLVKAAEVLIATNGYTSRLTPRLRRRVVPVGSHIIATEPLERELALACIPRRRTVYDTKGMLVYFRLSEDDRVVFGGRAAWTPTDARRSGRIMRRRMLEVFPQLAGAAIDFTWDGRVAMTLDLDPRLGRLDGLYYSMGYCGHGIALAPYLGHVIATVIAGRPEACPFLELKPFPAVPLYTGVPWFLPFVGGYYHARDRVL